MKKSEERAREGDRKICTKSSGTTRAMKIVIQICSFLRAESRDNILKKSILLW